QVAAYPELFASPRFWAYCAAAAFSSGAFFAFLGGAPFVGSDIYGLSASALGAYFAAPALGYFAGSFVSGRFSARVGVNPMVLIGALLCTGGLGTCLVLSLAGLSSAELYFGFMLFVGLGNGMVLPNATSGLMSVRPHLAGSAAGIGGALMMGGGAALSALAGVVLTGAVSATPLLALQVATSAASVMAILYVIRRERRLSLAAAAE
ncbi:MAG: MFS transporter, partial [Shimia sp.]